jgi:hypothetical protein
MRPLFCALALTASAFAASSAHAQLAKIDTAAKLLPPGSYECKLGSYAYRDCEVVAKGEGIELVTAPGIGHFIEFRAELLASDDKNQLTLLGSLTSPRNICDESCTPDGGDSDQCVGGIAEVRACNKQPLVARLKVSGRTAKGSLLYYINRPSYTDGAYSGFFKLGNTIDLSIRPKTKK